MQVLDKQQRDQGCPNLDAQRVFACTYEGFDLQVLFDGLEKQLDFPAVFVNRGNGGGSEFQMICQQDKLPFVDIVPYHNSAEKGGAFFLSLHAGQFHELVHEDIPVLGNSPVLDNFVEGIVFHPGDEEDTGSRPGTEERIVVVGPVKGDDGARRQVEQMGNGLVVLPRLGDTDVSRHIVVMIQQDMDLDPALGAAKARPGEQAEAEGNGRGVEAHELVLESEFSLSVLSEFAGVTEMLQERPEQALVECGRSVLIGVGESGALGAFGNPEMLELAKATGQSSANFPERVRMSEVAEEHGDKLRPATEPFCLVLGTMVDDQFLELGTGNMLKKLTKQTRNLYHGVALS